MIQAQPFGKIHSITLHPGDIVKWSIWNKETPKEETKLITGVSGIKIFMLGRKDMVLL